MKKMRETKFFEMKNNHNKETLKKISKSFRSGPSIFELIIENCKRNKIKLKIPDTLMYLPSMSFPIYLRTLSNGYISVDSSKVSISNFFSIKDAK